MLEDIPTGAALSSGLVGTLLSVAWLARGAVRRYSRDVAESTKDRAEGNLYFQLSEQVTNYRQVAEEATKDRNQLIERVARLETKLEQYEDLAKVNDRLKEQLDYKDKELSQKESDYKELVVTSKKERDKFLEILHQKEEAINLRDNRLDEMARKLQDMETRLMQDERTFSMQCPFKPSP